MAQRTDNLAAAKAILETPVDDLGDFDLAEAQARATVAMAEQLAALVKLLNDGDLHVVTHDGPRA